MVGLEFTFCCRTTTACSGNYSSLCVSFTNVHDRFSVKIDSLDARGGVVVIYTIFQFPLSGKRAGVCNVEVRTFSRVRGSSLYAKDLFVVATLRAQKKQLFHVVES